METIQRLACLILLAFASQVMAQTDALTILPNGNVGVGTTTPKTKLEVSGDIQSQTALIGNGGWGSNYASFSYKGLGNQKNNFAFLHRNDGKTILNASSGLSINFRINGVDKMALSKDGNFGIGTITPKKPIDVVKKGGIRISRTESASPDNEIFFQDNGQIRSGDNNHRLVFDRKNNTMEMREYGDIVFSPGAISGNRTQKITFKANGNVGIGTANPTQAKLVVNGRGNGQRFKYSFLNRGQPTGKNYTPSSNVYYSIYSSDRIAASEFNAFSDARIKNIFGVSNAVNDLETLSKIEITDYTMIDTISKGYQTHKKVIAQQLKEVYPQAVTDDITEVIPNIYTLSKITNGWITIPSKNLVVGDTIKLIFSEEEALVAVLEVKESAIKVTSDQEGDVFVYGKQISDFHTVDYEAIAMLNVSATQALLKRIELLEKEKVTLSRKQKQLEDHLNTSVSRIEKLETLFNNLK